MLSRQILYCGEQLQNDYLYDRLENGYEWKDDVLTVPMTKD